MAIRISRELTPRARDRKRRRLTLWVEGRRSEGGAYGYKLNITREEAASLESQLGRFNLPRQTCGLCKCLGCPRSKARFPRHRD